MENLEVFLNTSSLGAQKKSDARSLYQYSDYRRYLSDFYEARKAEKKSFSYRTFAARAGLGSPSHFQMIVKGERNLSLKTIPKFAKALNLNPKEAKYFEFLVQFNQATDSDLKSKYYSELLKLKPENSLKKLELEKYSYLSKWYVVALYSLIEVKEFNPDPKWVTEHLVSPVSASQIQEGYKILLELGLIKTDAKRGYVQAMGTVNTDDDTHQTAVYNYHKQMILLALHALKTQRPSRREMNGMTISVPKEKISLLKEKIRKFRAEILELADSFKDQDEVYQLNVQLFALSEEVK